MSVNQKINGIYRVVTLPRFYNAFQNLIGAESARKRYFSEWVTHNAEFDVLDVGCGPAIATRFIEYRSYTGIDINLPHIKAAQLQKIPETTFFHGDAEEVLVGLDRTFDVALSLGFLHHISDEKAHRTIDQIVSHLRPGGTAYFFEPVVLEPQRMAAKWLKQRDSGQHIRTEAAYRALIVNTESQLETRVSHDLLRVPYDHLWGKLKVR